MIGSRCRRIVFVIRYKRIGDGFCAQCLKPIPRGTRHYTVDNQGGLMHYTIKVHIGCIDAYGERIKKQGIEAEISKIKREHKHARRP